MLRNLVLAGSAKSNIDLMCKSRVATVSQHFQKFT